MARRPIGMRIFLLAATAVLALGSAGCGDGDATVAADDSAGGLTAEDLEGRAFESVRVEGRRLVDGTRVRLGFTGGEVQAHAGCNHLFGTLAIDGTTLTADDMGGTEMGCPGRLHDQDAWLTDFLTGGVEASLDGGSLTLTGGGAVVELAEQDTPADDGGSGDEPTSNDDEVVGSG